MKDIRIKLDPALRAEFRLRWSVRYPEPDLESGKLMTLLNTAMAPFSIGFDYGIEVTEIQEDFSRFTITMWQPITPKQLTMIRLRLSGYLDE